MNATAGGTVIRPAQKDDVTGLLALWRECGLILSASDTPDELARLTGDLGELFLVAEQGNTLVGSVMGSYDGRRGWINRLAVVPRERGRRLGDELVTALERALLARGCRKVNLLIETSNQGVQSYYERLGFNRDELIFMEKWLDRSEPGQP